MDFKGTAAIDQIGCFLKLVVVLVPKKYNINEAKQYASAMRCNTPKMRVSLIGDNAQ